MARTKTSVRYKAEEKRRRALIIAIILFLIGLVMIIAGTFAYYQTNVTGSVGGNVLAWNFKANNSTSSFTITLTPDSALSCNTATTLNSTIAPGTCGSFTINLSTTISANYTITFSNFVNKPANLKFYSDSSFNTETDITASGYSITGSLANNGTVAKTIYWKWDFGTSSSITADNTASDKSVSFSANVVGRQT